MNPDRIKEMGDVVTPAEIANGCRCEFCDYRASNRWELGAHKKASHGVDLWKKRATEGPVERPTAAPAAELEPPDDPGEEGEERGERIPALPPATRECPHCHQQFKRLGKHEPTCPMKGRPPPPPAQQTEPPSPKETPMPRPRTKCQFCSKPYKQAKRLETHEADCLENPKNAGAKRALGADDEKPPRATRTARRTRNTPPPQEDSPSALPFCYACGFDFSKVLAEEGIQIKHCVGCGAELGKVTVEG